MLKAILIQVRGLLSAKILDAPWISMMLTAGATREYLITRTREELQRTPSDLVLCLRLIALALAIENLQLTGGISANTAKTITRTRKDHTGEVLRSSTKD